MHARKNREICPLSMMTPRTTFFSAVLSCHTDQAAWHHFSIRAENEVLARISVQRNTGRLHLGRWSDLLSLTLPMCPLQKTSSPYFNAPWAANQPASQTEAFSVQATGFNSQWYFIVSKWALQRISCSGRLPSEAEPTSTRVSTRPVALNTIAESLACIPSFCNLSMLRVSSS